MYERFIAKLKEVRTLDAVGSLLSWDQETYMPPKTAAARAEQLALVSGLVHEKLVSDEMGALLEELSGRPLDPEQAANVREVRRVFERERKLPTELVREIARTRSLAHEAWVAARKAADFERFAPWLEKNLALQKEVAERTGYEEEPYDALLDWYEPGARARRIAPLFEALRARIVPLVQAIGRSGKRPRKIQGRFPLERQRAFGERIARDMGYDFEAGRLDVSAHPFCTGMHPTDVRITTRYDEADFRDSLFGILHEAGHALYEQGFDPRHAQTPMGEAASTAIHESQSRLWENLVGRSRPFWRHYYPLLREAFPEALGDVALDDFYFAINEVEPSFIRVEADEVTYNLHIVLRFEIERDLFSGRASVSDLPALWNRKMEELLGIVPPDDAKGVLQDTHWSWGLFGYFPTYTLGNLYAAQFYAAAAREIPDLEARIGRGELLPLREWLRERIHRRGAFFRPEDLCRDVTGAPLDASHFVSYLEQKFGALYGT